MGDESALVSVSAIIQFDAVVNIKLKKISAGNNHTCYILKNGDLKCWGANFHGQLGQGTKTIWDGQAGITDNQNIGHQPGQMGDNLKAVVLGANRKALAVTAGAYHTCIVLDNAQVKCWGSNDRGQPGQGTKTTYNADGTINVNKDLGDDEHVSTIQPVPL